MHWLGSASNATTSTGSMDGAERYYPYGLTRTAGGGFGSNRRFTEQFKDTETALYFYNARYYDPAIGRFMAPDSLVPDPYDPRSYNRYSYVTNNPLKYTDPTGHECRTIYLVFYFVTICDGGSPIAPYPPVVPEFTLPDLPEFIPPSEAWQRTKDLFQGLFLSKETDLRKKIRGKADAVDEHTEKIEEAIAKGEPKSIKGWLDDIDRNLAQGEAFAEKAGQSEATVKARQALAAAKARADAAKNAAVEKWSNLFAQEQDGGH